MELVPPMAPKLFFVTISPDSSHPINYNETIANLFFSEHVQLVRLREDAPLRELPGVHHNNNDDHNHDHNDNYDDHDDHSQEGAGGGGVPRSGADGGTARAHRSGSPGPLE